MFTPEVIWMMIGGSAIVVFGAGRVVEKIFNHRYVSTILCAKIHEDEKRLADERQKAADERWTLIRGDIEYIRGDVGYIRNWMDSQK